MVADFSVLFGFVMAAFVGSWHCAAMCGPVAVGIGRVRSLWPYHFGRAISYISLGAVAGKIGESVLDISTFSHLSGVVILTVILLTTQLPTPRLVRDHAGWLFMLVTKLRPGPFLFGLFSALLPCGRLWTFVAAAAATGSAWAGGVVTGSLWLSSIPALSLAAAYFRTSLRIAEPRRTLWISRALIGASIYGLWAHFL